MTGYRRDFIAGGSFFFTVDLAERRLSLLTQYIDELNYNYGDGALQLDVSGFCAHFDILAGWEPPANPTDLPGRVASEHPCQAPPEKIF